MKNGTIYILRDPRIKDKIKSIRYVGTTIQPLKTRLSDHIGEGKRYIKRTHKNNWIKNLQRDNCEPIIEKIDEIAMKYMFSKEIEYIRKYKELGCKLVNSTEGGEGLLNPTKKTRKKISIAQRNNKNGVGHKLSKNLREELSLMKMGNKGRMGIPHTMETKEKLRISHSGDKSSSAKLTWDEVKEIRKKYKTGDYTQQLLADDYGVTLGTINPLLKYKTWKI